nr:hypothetical protein [uncultured Rhodopila sp.]
MAAHEAVNQLVEGQAAKLAINKTEAVAQAQTPARGRGDTIAGAAAADPGSSHVAPGDRAAGGQGLLR